MREREKEYPHDNVPYDEYVQSGDFGFTPFDYRCPAATRLRAFAGPKQAHPEQTRDTTMTRLDKPLRRELKIDDRLYTLSIDALGLKLAQKGHRKGVALKWQDLLNGDAALAAALQASVH